MKLINFKTVPFIIAGFLIMTLSGCNGTTGTSSDSGITGTTTITTNTIFFENNTSLALTDMSTVTSDINATNATTYITKIIVDINASGVVPYDNEYRLKGPSGTTILLSDNRGTGPTFIATFDDNASTLMSDQTTGSTINGNYVPEEPLAAFEGENANGTWTLIVTDNIGGFTNTLNSWSLTIE